jgi:hypothetical protein
MPLPWKQKKYIRRKRKRVFDKVQVGRKPEVDYDPRRIVCSAEYIKRSYYGTN